MTRLRGWKAVAVVSFGVVLLGVAFSHSDPAAEWDTLVAVQPTYRDTFSICSLKRWSPGPVRADLLHCCFYLVWERRDQPRREFVIGSWRSEPGDLQLRLRSEEDVPTGVWVVCAGKPVAALDLQTGTFVNHHGWLVDPTLSRREQESTMVAITADGSWVPREVLPWGAMPNWATPDGGELLGHVPGTGFEARRPSLPMETVIP